jgi:TetR/AcrR family transcriptional regulator
LKRASTAAEAGPGKGRRPKETAAPKKRSQGRPSANVVGRETILEAARKQLQELAPARVTISSIAREAGVDPALVRYYFGDREQLLLAVIDRIVESLPNVGGEGVEPIEALKARIRGGLQFTRSAKNMHQLMIDELAANKSAAVRERQAANNKAAVAHYAKIMERDGGRQLNPADPLFLFIAVVGIFDFFVTAEPVIRNMAPEGTDMEELGKAFEEFVVDLVLNGMLKR